MVQLTSLLFGAALSASYASASGPPVQPQCGPYMPVGWNTTNRGRIHFYDNNPNDEPANGPGFHAPTLPANSTALNPWVLNDKNGGSEGTIYHFRACNVTSLNLKSPSTQSSCSHGGCYITYTNFIEVINPHTGHCLTALDGWNATSTKLGFQNCSATITNRDQLWETDQQVLYSPGFGKITSYGTVDFSIIEPGQGDFEFSGPFLAWALDRADNKTVEVIQFPYTQDGLSATVLEP